MIYWNKVYYASSNLALQPKQTKNMITLYTFFHEFSYNVEKNPFNGFNDEIYIDHIYNDFFISEQEMTQRIKGILDEDYEFFIHIQKMSIDDREIINFLNGKERIKTFDNEILFSGNQEEYKNYIKNKF